MSVQRVHSYLLEERALLYRTRVRWSFYALRIIQYSIRKEIPRRQLSQEYSDLLCKPTNEVHEEAIGFDALPVDTQIKPETGTTRQFKRLSDRFPGTQDKSQKHDKMFCFFCHAKQVDINWLDF